MEFLLIIIWLIPAFFIANRAQKQGRSYIVFLIISFILGPVLGSIILLIAGENNEKLKKMEIIKSTINKEEDKDIIDDMGNTINIDNNNSTQDDTVIMDDKWLCRNCGNINDIYIISCKKCGKQLKIS